MTRTRVDKSIANRRGRLPLGPTGRTDAFDDKNKSGAKKWGLDVDFWELISDYSLRAYRYSGGSDEFPHSSAHGPHTGPHRAYATAANRGVPN